MIPLASSISANQTLTENTLLGGLAASCLANTATLLCQILSVRETHLVACKLSGKHLENNPFRFLRHTP